MDPRDLMTEAVRCGTTGCLVWKPGADTRVRRDAQLQGLTPEGIVTILTEYVSNGEASLTQKAETRDNWRGQNDYVYDILITLPDFPRDLYIELILSDPVDEACPVAIIVSAHLSSFSRRKK